MSEDNLNKRKPGWGKPACSRKWHYFQGDNATRSLCGRVGFYFGSTETGSDDSAENCAECKKRKLREAAK